MIAGRRPWWVARVSLTVAMATVTVLALLTP